MTAITVIFWLVFTISTIVAETVKTVHLDPCAYISSFTLIDARMNKTIGALPFQIHLGDYSSTNTAKVAPAFNIKVEINDSNCPSEQRIRSVFVEYTSTAEKPRRFCEVQAPFMVFGDSALDSSTTGTIFILGRHIFPNVTANATIRAIPYFEENCNHGDDTTNSSSNTTTENSVVIRRGKLKQQSFQILASNETKCYMWKLLKTFKGKAKLDSFGYALSMSGNGCTIAIGAPGSDENGDNSGTVQVWSCASNESTLYTKLGADLYGENEFDSGFWTHKSLAISADGTIVARGANGNDESGQDAGHVQVWRWNESTASWERMGQDIDGKAAKEVSGATVEMSGDGTVLAINSGSGHRIWRWDASKGKWLQRGQDIRGFILAMSADAKIFAVKPNVEIGTPQPLQVWQWIAMNKTFVQRGQDFFGEDPQNENFGTSVALSAEGNIMAVGVSNIFTLAVKIVVYRWEADTSTWTQLGQDIVDSTDVFFGSQIALTRDGKTVAIGHQKKDPSNNIETNGHVRVWRWDEGIRTWNQLGNEIEGEQLSDRTGDSLAISADGSVIAVSAPNAVNKRGNPVGLVRVWKLVRTACDALMIASK